MLTQWVVKINDLVTNGLAKIDAKTRNVIQRFDKLQSSINKTQDAGNKLYNAFRNIAIISTIKTAGMDMLETAKQTEGLTRMLGFVEGSAQAGAMKYDQLTKMADKYGVSLGSIIDGYKTIGAASKGTSLAGSTGDLLESVTMASSVLGLTQEQSTGALLAISQMISKGTVSAEELRGQLGERLPGAMQIMARALNVTTQELDKMLVSGSLAAQDVLPKFAQQLKTEFGGAAEGAANGITALANRVENAWLQFQQFISTDILPLFTEILTGAMNAMNWLKDNWGLVKDVLAGVWNGLKIILPVMALLTAAVWAQNAAWLANPLTRIAIAVMGVATALTLLWRRSETFRATILTLWDVVRPFWDFTTKILSGFVSIVGKLISGMVEVGKAVVKWVLKPFKLIAEGIDALTGNAISKLYNYHKWAESNHTPAGSGRGNMAAGMHTAFAGRGSNTQTNDALAKASKGSLEGSSQRKYITVNINKLVETFRVETTNLNGMSMKQVEDKITEVIVRAVGGAELNLGN